MRKIKIPKNKLKKWIRKFQRINTLFKYIVILPTCCSIFYFSLWASDIYISQSSFVVRTPKNQAALSGVGALLQSSGFARAQDDTYTVQEFMRSRSTLELLEKNIPIRQFYEDKGDLFSRFNPLNIFSEQEAFYQYFSKKLSVNFDSVSGIATLNIRAFDPKEAQQINQELLKQGEYLINRLNERARKDTIMFAELAVSEAEKKVTETSSALSEYRIKNGVFDLQSQSEVQLSLISTLQNELITIQTQLDQLRSISPNNPQVQTLLARASSIRKEMQQQVQQVLGGRNSIVTQTAEYQRLVLNNTLAQQQLGTAITSLQNARSEADRQQLYLEIISYPNEPDLALEPYRLYNILATLFISLILYGITLLLLASIREHKN
ncbi:capsule biosynthesis protein [Pasteurella multocida]|uniref:capsule biosynthesis protein n=1 Tax=Pasteurella multocida TaxID=747 RepID=UPI000D36AB73|nr:capsule biosynthesis protein [Pasteurella multocida]AWB53671.1 capsule biosynthesis protein [Pasteurella multocida]MCL7818008.1 capsule biosynthesis protein [Pasteurella multocida]MEB3458212.1 capsule biosynthesis protein [Pasteurella multocida]MEB3466542.1 capsule biosynthesis protein [Pasteurella multocida]MEB3486228.1 capsule biosynthesis protein [Pasteurella multocida]